MISYMQYKYITVLMSNFLYTAISYSHVERGIGYKQHKYIQALMICLIFYSSSCLETPERGRQGRKEDLVTATEIAINLIDWVNQLFN